MCGDSALLGFLRLGQGLNSEPVEFMLTKAGLKAQPDVCFLMIYSSSSNRSNYSDPKSHQINFTSTLGYSPSAWHRSPCCLLPSALAAFLPEAMLCLVKSFAVIAWVSEWVSMHPAINRGELHRLAVQIQVIALHFLRLAFTMIPTSLRLTCNRHMQGHKANPID